MNLYMFLSRRVDLQHLLKRNKTINDLVFIYLPLASTLSPLLATSLLLNLSCCHFVASDTTFARGSAPSVASIYLSRSADHWQFIAQLPHTVCSLLASPLTTLVSCPHTNSLNLLPPLQSFDFSKYTAFCNAPRYTLW